MKKVFNKPIGHFIPLVSGVKAEDLATLNEAELAEPPLAIIRNQEVREPKWL